MLRRGEQHYRHRWEKRIWKEQHLRSDGGLSLLKPLGNGYLRNRNRHSPDEALVSVTVELEFEPHEIREHSMDPMPTTIDLDSTRVVVRGGLKKLISEDRQLLEVIERLCETRNDASIWGQGNSRVKEIDKIFASLGDIETTIFGEYESKLRTLTNWVTGGRKELIAGDVEFIVQRIQSYYGMLPRVHYWDSDREFLYSYSFEQIQASFADERHMFSRFLKAGRISRDEIIKALTHPNEGVRENARSLIEGKIRDNISERFNEFYRQEPVRVRCAFENKVFRTFVSTCGDFLELTERSNGLRWFFSLFIDAISDSDEDADTSVLYLLDEPGVHLHVNAQKELLRFFADLTAERNQIVYSTHSPYMIDNRDILNVRVVQKDENGGSKIFRNAYH